MGSDMGIWTLFLHLKESCCPLLIYPYLSNLNKNNKIILFSNIPMLVFCVFPDFCLPDDSETIGITCLSPWHVPWLEFPQKIFYFTRYLTRISLTIYLTSYLSRVSLTIFSRISSLSRVSLPWSFPDLTFPESSFPDLDFPWLGVPWLKFPWHKFLLIKFPLIEFPWLAVSQTCAYLSDEY